MSATRVSVTEKHIAAGEPQNPRACAVARAVTDALRAADAGSCIGIFCGTDDADPYAGWKAVARRPEGRFSAPVGRDVIDWIGNFDAGRPVEPFELELTWEDE